MLLVDTEAGEEIIINCPSCGYAANVEKATFADGTNPTIDAELKPMQVVDTPGASTIEQVTAFLKCDASRLVKTLIYMADGKPVAALVRGDRDLNETKLKNALKAIELEMANPVQVEQATNAPVGFAGPVGLTGIAILVDPLVAKVKNSVVGANRNEKHIVNVNIERDFKATQIVDLSKAQGGDLCPMCKGKLVAKDGIEVGNTFQLGTKYSETLGATFLDAEGKEHPMIMGSYGIGITRTPQAALEKYHDDKGIIWPKSIAPYLVEVIPVNQDKPNLAEAAETIYRLLTEAGIEVLYDDRPERAGVKFNDAGLIGLPIRVTIGDKSLKDGKVELKSRASDQVELVAPGDIVAAVRRLASGLR